MADQYLEPMPVVDNRELYPLVLFGCKDITILGLTKLTRKEKKNYLDDSSLKPYEPIIVAKLNTGPIQRPFSIGALNVDWEKANPLNREASVIPSA